VEWLLPFVEVSAVCPVVVVSEPLAVVRGHHHERVPGELPLFQCVEHEGAHEGWGLIPEAGEPFGECLGLRRRAGSERLDEQKADDGRGL